MDRPKVDPDPPFARTPEEAAERRLEERAWNAIARMGCLATPDLLLLTKDMLRAKEND